MSGSIVAVDEAPGGECLSLLDERTQLVGVKVRPTCGEAVAYVRAGRRPERVLSDCPPDAATLEENRLRANRRRHSQARRYCVANVICRMVTVTYAGEGCHDREQAMRDTAAFLRRLRLYLGRAYPALWVPELHPGGHGWHVHIAMGPWVEKKALTRLWGHGIVDVRLIRDRTGKPAGRQVASYVAKQVAGYVGKELDGVSAGGHAYEVTQGFQPEVITVAADSLEEAQGIAASFFGGEVASSSWSSSEVKEWKGLPVRWWGWSEW